MTTKSLEEINAELAELSQEEYEARIMQQYNEFLEEMHYLNECNQYESDLENDSLD